MHLPVQRLNIVKLNRMCVVCFWLVILVRVGIEILVYILNVISISYTST